MQLFPKRKKRSSPKHVTKIGFLPDTKKFNGLRFAKHATSTSSKIEANHRVVELRKQGRMARKIKDKNGMWVIYSRGKNV